MTEYEGVSLTQVQPDGVGSKTQPKSPDVDATSTPNRLTLPLFLRLFRSTLVLTSLPLITIYWQSKYIYRSY